MPSKVLIAERSGKVQKELTQLLQEAGFEVKSVNNGEYAVRELVTFQPDLVLADIFMPVRSGFEVCAHIKSDPDLNHIAVLLLANKMEPYDDQRAIVVGADGKLEKPFDDPQALLQTVTRQLAARAEALAEPGHGGGALPRTASAPTAKMETPAEWDEPVVEADLFYSGPKPAELPLQETPFSVLDLFPETISVALDAAIRKTCEDALALARAKNAGDFAVYYADDAVLLPPNAAPVTGKLAVRAYWSQLFARPEFAVDWQVARVELARAGDLAFLYGGLVLRGQDAQGQPVAHSAKYLQVLRKHGADWKIAVHIWNASPATAPKG